MSVRWIIADVDGCLTPEESIAWDLEHLAELAAITRAAAAGTGATAPLTLCTGRPQPYVEVLAKLLDVRAPAICENGAVFYTLADNHAWFARGVTPEKIHGLRTLRAFITEDLLPAHPGTVLQYGKEAQISVFSENPELLPPLVGPIREFTRRQGGPELVINTSLFYLNISLKGVDKGAAIAELLEMLGTRREEVAGIGDTEGDLPLREAVGWFACPANARDAIKEVADYTAPHPLLEGILDILRRPELSRTKA